MIQRNQSTGLKMEQLCGARSCPIERVRKKGRKIENGIVFVLVVVVFLFFSFFFCDNKLLTRFGNVFAASLPLCLLLSLFFSLSHTHTHTFFQTHAVCVPFVDDRTVALFVLIQVYNPSNNIFSRLETATIFPLSGDVVNENKFEGGWLVINANREREKQQVLWTSLLVAWMIIELLLWIKEVYDGSVPFSNAAALDVLVHFLSCWFIYNNGNDFVFSFTEKDLASKLNSTDKVEDLHHLLERKWTTLMLQAYLAMTLILQFFKFLGVLNRRLRIVYNTMVRVTGDLVYWLLLLSIVIVGLVVSGNTFFGSDTKNFSSFGAGLNSIFRLVILDFDYKGVEKAPPFIVIPYYVMSSITVYFVLLNLFTTIVLRSWDVEKRYFDEEEKNATKSTSGWTLKRMIEYIVRFRWLRDLCTALRNPSYYVNKAIELWREAFARMEPSDVAIRLIAWHGKRENLRKKYLQFADIKSAMEGMERNRRVVTDYQVQIVFKYCKQKNDGDEKLLLTRREKEELEMEALGQLMEEEEREKDTGFDTKLALKQLVKTMGAIERYQQDFWGGMSGTMKQIHYQTREAQKRAIGVRDRLEKLVPNSECCCWLLLLLVVVV